MQLKREAKFVFNDPPGCETRAGFLVLGVDDLVPEIIRLREYTMAQRKES